MGNCYNVVFQGRIMPGKEEQEVKKSLQAALKVGEQNINKLFCGKSVIIKKHTDSATAEKYKRLFSAAGALCEIYEEASDSSQPMSQAGPSPAAHAASESISSAPQPSNAQVKVHYMKTSHGGKMIITNIETVPGKRVTEHFGLVSGSTIRAKHIGRDIMASLKNLVGGELKGYTQLLQESRQQATDRMIEEAHRLGANAIVNVRFSTSSVAQGAAELYAYGTAVTVE